MLVVEAMVEDQITQHHVKGQGQRQKPGQCSHFRHGWRKRGYRRRLRGSNMRGWGKPGERGAWKRNGISKEGSASVSQIR